MKKPGTPRPLTEKQICQQIIDYCQIQHIPLFRNNVGVMCRENTDGTARYVTFGEVGMADYTLILFLQGLPLIVYLEVKTMTGEQSEKQRQFQQWCESQSICYILARSVEDLEQALATYRKHILTTLLTRNPSS